MGHVPLSLDEKIIFEGWTEKKNDRHIRAQTHKTTRLKKILDPNVTVLWWCVVV
jgi:hypothetical protein